MRCEAKGEWEEDTGAPLLRNVRRGGGLVITFGARKSGLGELQQPSDTALFQSDFPLLIQPPPQKNQNVLHETIVYEALISRN